MNAYIVTGFRTAVGKAKRGGFKSSRPDDLAAEVIKYLVKSIPNLDPERIDDVIVGNAIPEGEQGMQMGRLISLLSLPVSVPGMVLNRYCGSGLEAIGLASARIHAGTADCIIAGGAESMSLLPMMGYKTALNWNIVNEHPEYMLSMGLTAEEIVRDYGITREEQDTFSLNSHKKALKAIEEGKFKSQIVPIEVEDIYYEDGQKKTRKYIVDTDEGPRADTSMEGLARLRPAFAYDGTVTAGNSSQSSDGAAFVLVMSERMINELGLKPRLKLVAYTSAGVDPRIMGIGPVAAIPKALKQAGLKLEDIDLIELNEAFAAQSLAVIRDLKIDESKLNINGGAIALGHPLGCTGAKLTIQIMNELENQNKRYGMVTACIGGGQGIAGIFERVN
ncbi:MAG: acetyl-CoA C-acyltransferase [Flexibacter sp. CG_4_10_14_3_um_filter_32_15]|nr:MAG: acetyl-CoA C-acyltransferase [Flexibacter sp. CG_4_10_14_3_um_filter_32_15]